MKIMEPPMAGDRETFPRLLGGCLILLFNQLPTVDDTPSPPSADENSHRKRWRPRSGPSANLPPAMAAVSTTLTGAPGALKTAPLSRADCLGSDARINDAAFQLPQLEHTPHPVGGGTRGARRRPLLLRRRMGLLHAR